MSKFFGGLDHLSIVAFDVS